MKRLTATAFAALSLSVAVPAAAQSVAPPPVAAQPAATTARPRTILFVGNSFTQGAHSAVRNYRADIVTDLNGDGYGGVPALFKTFTEEAGLNYAVSLETQGGKPLGFHWAERRGKLGGAWDVVILQELSTLDRDAPGDASGMRKFAPLFADMFRRANPQVDVELMATWSRADLTYKPGSPWSGKSITAMANDLRAATDSVKAATPNINGVLPVGQAWSRAIAAGVADPNPYDGTSFGQVDLWTYDQYHGSIFGYYLEALVVFGRVTGIDPTTLGVNERAADQLGIAPKVATQLQMIARDELAANAVRSK
jgi:hypothetical protein